MLNLNHNRFIANKLKDEKILFRDITSFKGTRLRKEYKHWLFTVILVQTENFGNIGSVARIMKNFSFDNLVIFNPKEEIQKIQNHEAQGFAMHGKDILLSAEFITINDEENHLSKLKEYLKNYDLVIATTAKGKRYTNIRRLAIFPHEFQFPYSRKPLKVAIIFGKESRGLTNDEISLADIILRIPTDNDYSALNLSHACGIILYEIFKKIHILEIGRGEKPVLVADRENRQNLYIIIKHLITLLKIRAYKKNNLFFAFRNVIERSFVSKRELSLITGLFSKLEKIIKELDLYE